MRKIILLLFVLFIGTQANCQIVNVESLRKVSDTSKWSGNTSLDLSLIKNVNDIFRVTNRTHLQYQNNEHLYLLVTNLNFQQLEKNDFINTGIIHLRYNYRFRPRIAWELFTQSQYDAISNIDYRLLLGTGPRFKLGTSDKYNFYLGSLVMYEYEKSSESFGEANRRDVRGSTYFSMALHPTDKASVISTTYYQPRLSSFGDYRISNETSVAFELYRGLGFKSTFSLFFDAFPPSGTPKTQYTWTNGVVYTFD